MADQTSNISWVTPAFGVAGVVLGFGLGWLKDYVRESRRREKFAYALGDEMKGNRQATVQKIDILNQVEEALARGQLLSPAGVRFANTIYEKHFPDLAGEITAIERNSFHVIYETQRIFDNSCEDLETMLPEAVSSTETLARAIKAYRVKIPDLRNCLSVIAVLIEKHLSGRPEDVMHTALPPAEIINRLAEQRQQKRKQSKS